MPTLDSKAVTLTGPFRGLDFFKPISGHVTRGRGGNHQKHFLTATNVRCKEQVIKTAPGNCRIPSKPASLSAYNMLRQWPILKGDKVEVLY